MYEILKITATSFLGLLTGIGLAYYKYYLDNKKKPGTTFDADLDRRNRIKEFLLDTLSELMGPVRPARVAAYLLHNGGILFNGDHIQRIKLYEEQCRDRSVPRLRKDFDSVLIEGGIHTWIDLMRKNGKQTPYEEVCSHLSSPTLPVDVAAFLEYYKIASSYAMLLRNPQTKAPIAIFVVSYDAPCDFTPAMLVGLRGQAHRLEKLLLAKAQ